VLDANDVVLLVDDWAERGSQAVGVRQLVERSGSSFAGVSLMVDQLDEQTRAKLGRVTALVSADELGDPDA
jgi:adenine phosphoribosyltransferase